jgi:hypothetical protein
MADDRLEYRERIAVWDAKNGTVELYMAWRRDYLSCCARLTEKGVKPAIQEELNPGYRIVLRAEDSISLKMLISPPRAPISEERKQILSERMKRMQQNKRALDCDDR